MTLKSTRKLRLKKESLRQLTPDQLGQVQGGAINLRPTIICPSLGDLTTSLSFVWTNCGTEGSAFCIKP